MSTEDTSVKSEPELGATQEKRTTVEIIDIGNEIDNCMATIEGIATSFSFAMYMSGKVIAEMFEEKNRRLEKYGKLIEAYADGRKRYSVNAPYTNKIDEVERDLKNFRIGRETLPKSQLVALVSTFDAFFGRLARWYFLKQPEALQSSERNIGLSQLLEFPSIDAAKEYFLEKEVETVLRESHTAHFEWFEKKLSRRLREGLGIWGEFIEITERRNLLVHTDGRISRQYVDACTKAGVEFDSPREPGDQLGVPAEYFRRAAEVFLELGVKLGQTVWRIVARDELEQADTALIRLIYEMLEKERFKLAKTLSEFAAQLPRHASEANKRIIIVNHAQSVKWLGDDDQANKILAEHDWSSCGPEYRLCVEVIRDRFEQAAQVMTEIGACGRVNKAAYLTWPVFRRFRESEEFCARFREIFGHDPSEEVENREEENGPGRPSNEGESRAVISGDTIEAQKDANN